ncbi:MAG: hypothetical protein Roseis2KO_51390 [Roseivirga sp.]
MEQATLWFDRKFAFDHLKGTFPSIYERLDGLLLRLEHKLSSIPVAHLETKIEGRWSIKEHVGHLLDLEDLWIARMEDFHNGKTALSPADLENRKTHEAGHNQRSIEELTRALTQKRAVLLALCKKSEHRAEVLTALHPRLKQPMRLIDLAYFVAEHDDHHLAAITEIHRQLTN